LKNVPLNSPTQNQWPLSISNAFPTAYQPNLPVYLPRFSMSAAFPEAAKTADNSTRSD